MSAKQRVKGFWERNKDRIFVLAIGFLLFSGGLQKVVNVLRKNLVPVDVEQLQKDVEKYRNENFEMYEQIRILTPLVNENANQIDKLTKFIENNEERWNHNNERWEKQFNFNGLVEGKLGITENARKSNFRGHHITSGENENN